MINIHVDDTHQDSDLQNPIDIWGAKHGEVYRMYDNGEPSDTYFIGAGGNENPIDIWWDDEDNKYRLSSSSREDLCSFNPHIKVKKIDADISIDLIIK